MCDISDLFFGVFTMSSIDLTEDILGVDKQNFILAVRLLFSFVKKP
jgi:hypothetical protein